MCMCVCFSVHVHAYVCVRVCGLFDDIGILFSIPHIGYKHTATSLANEGAFASSKLAVSTLEHESVGQQLELRGFPAKLPQIKSKIKYSINGADVQPGAFLSVVQKGSIFMYIYIAFIYVTYDVGLHM